MATKVSLGFAKLADTELDDFAQAVNDAMTGNATYPTPPVTMANLKTAKDDFTAKMAAAFTAVWGLLGILVWMSVSVSMDWGTHAVAQERLGVEPPQRPGPVEPMRPLRVPIGASPGEGHSPVRHRARRR